MEKGRQGELSSVCSSCLPISLSPYLFVSLSLCLLVCLRVRLLVPEHHSLQDVRLLASQLGVLHHVAPSFGVIREFLAGGDLERLVSAIVQGHVFFFFHDVDQRF